MKKSGLILNDWKWQYWNFTGNQLLPLAALEAEFILKKGNPSLAEVFEVIQNLKLVLTLKGNVSMPVFILEAWSLHILLCPIYTSLNNEALFCQLAAREKCN